MNVFTINYDETHQQTRDVDRDNQCRQLKLSTDRTATRMMMFLSLSILSSSLEFNLKSKVFMDLFPDLKKDAEEEIARRNLIQSQQVPVPVREIIKISKQKGGGA